MFNYAIVTAVPSWLYEKAPDVKAESAVGQSCLISSIMYVIVGSFGALSIPNVPPNVLSVLSSGNMGPVASIFASMFTFFIVGLGIPLFSVLIRLNLVGSGFCSERVGQHLTTTLPWAISWILYQGEFVQILMSWGGILMSLIVFVAPLYLACNVTFSSDVSKDALDPSIVDQKATRMEQVELILLSAVSAVVISVALFCQG
uniref:Amino acid transporter transmembrane domain-containing protein n=1 Tax=Leptocylindrus danicus TaxID=163516 RepID=A0A7S2LQG8_9STRA